MRLLPAAVLATLLVTPACDPFGDEIAVTVGDERIAFAQVEGLARNEAFLQQLQLRGGDGERGRLGGDLARSVADFLVVNEIARAEVAAAGGPFTPDTAGLADVEGLSADAREALGTRRALGEALRAAVGSDGGTRRIAELARRYAAAEPAERREVCGEGVAAPAEAAGTIRADLERGLSMSEVAQAGQFQLIARDAQPGCFRRGELADIGDRLLAARPGELVETTSRGRTGEAVIFFRVQEVTESTAAEAAAAIEASVGEGNLDLWIRMAARFAGVEVDSRLGRFDPGSLRIDPPSAPLPSRSRDTSGPAPGPAAP